MENTQLIIQKAAQAVDSLNAISDRVVQEILLATADALEANIDSILMSNEIDLSHITPDNPKYDRLKLTEERVSGMAGDMRKVAGLPSPLGKLLMEVQRPNGMKIRKVSVPFGVIGVIYEARPNVTCDVFSLCLKSGNVCVLKGGSDAYLSNRVLVEIIREVLVQKEVNPNVCSLLPPDRSATSELLNAVGMVDLLIPRGSSSLIQYVRENARIPVIETGAGICHTYFDLKGDREKGRSIVLNAKTRRVSVCNALDCLLMHTNRLDDLPYICEPLAEKHVVIYADIPAYLALEGKYPSELLQHAERQHYGTEFLDYKMSIRTVSSLQDALHHISLYSSKHSECIVSEDEAVIAAFQRSVDAACVYANVSTAFTDGAQFGFGAEIGISTQKLHARGPMALPELTTYKYLITGDGQVRNP